MWHVNFLIYTPHYTTSKLVIKDDGAVVAIKEMKKKGILKFITLKWMVNL